MTIKGIHQKETHMSAQKPYVLAKEPYSVPICSGEPQLWIIIKCRGPFIRRTALYIRQRALCIHKRALFCVKSCVRTSATDYRKQSSMRAIYVFRKTLYVRKRALFCVNPCVGTSATDNHQSYRNEPYVSSKEPYISAKELYSVSICQ